MGEAMASTPERRYPVRRSRWKTITVTVYVVALIASTLVWRPGGAQDRALPEGWASVAVPEVTDDGAATGESTRLAVLDTGPGPGSSRGTVLLFHGSPGQGSDMTKLGIEFAGAGFRVVTLDQPGFGHSTLDAADLSCLATARQSIALMDELAIASAHVIGWSRGSGVGIHMADLAPERVETLTILAGVGSQEGEGSGVYALEQIKYALGLGATSFVRHGVPHFGLLDYGTALSRGFLRSFADSDFRRFPPILAQTEVPILILHGRDDPLVAARSALLHFEMAPTSRLLMTPHTHFMPFMRPAETADQIVGFIDDVARDGAVAHEIIEIEPASMAPADRLGRWAGGLPWWVWMITGLGVALWSRPAAAAFAGLLAVGPKVDPFLVFEPLWIAAVLAHVRARPGGFLGIARSVLGATGETIARGVAAMIIATAVTMALGVGFVGGVAAFGAAWFAAWAAPMLFTTYGWARLRGALSRCLRPEYWPTWARYAPQAPTVARLAARHGGLMTWTCCNPGIRPGGGVICESKHRIQSGIRASAEVALPTALIPAGRGGERADAAIRVIRSHDELNGYPVILKPDDGFRGYAVRIARDDDGVRAYANDVRGAFVVQRYHAGPGECSVLWMRTGPESGRVYSITDKRFPEIVGDGRSTIGELIRRDARLRRQLDVFLSRMRGRWDEIPPDGERVRVGYTGNHAQGAEFLDGERLRSPELERAIDGLCLGYEGEGGGGLDHVRLDLRYESEAALRAGEGFGVVEINGVTGESTNMYDPSFGLRRGGEILRGQIRYLYERGEENRRNGVAPMGALELALLLVRGFARRLRPVSSS